MNAPIMVIAKILKMVVASVTDADIAALYHNARAIVPLRVKYEELGHPQPVTPIRADNIIANGILNRTVEQCHIKVIDMHFYWLKVHWVPNKVNLANYHSKHHSATHTKKARKLHLKEPDSSRSLQGCDKIHG